VNVLRALTDRELPEAQRREKSARGHFTVRADELEQHPKLSQDAVAESLGRLAAVDKGMNIGELPMTKSPGITLSIHSRVCAVRSGMRICSWCGDDLVRRGRHGLIQRRILSLFSLYPWRCRACSSLRYRFKRSTDS